MLGSAGPEIQAGGGVDRDSAPPQSSLRMASHPEHPVVQALTLTDIVVGSGFAFNDAGEHVLKGVPGRWELFALEAGPAPHA